MVGPIFLPNGDPDYQSVEDLGPAAPTNFVLDPDPDKPLSQFVLETFDIPFAAHPTTSRVLGGSLPGYDIKNSDAATMLKLSLAVELRDGPPVGSSDPAGLGAFAEVEIDEFGIARFFVVGEDLASDLDIRYCIPTNQIRNAADLVIVRGYDPPPRRELRPSFNGLKNAEVMDYISCAEDTCDQTAVGKFASVSYDDPLLDQVYLDDIVNSYELQAFESLIGYLVDLDLPEGADEDDPNFIRGLKITFGDTTKEYITLPVSIFANSLSVGTIGSTNGITGGVTMEGAIVSDNRGGAIDATFGDSTITTAVPMGSLTPKEGECSDTDVSVVGSKVVIPASRFQRLNKYGELESDFAAVQDVVFGGQKVVFISTFGTGVGIYVKPNKELISLSQGTNWTWTTNEAGDLELEFFSYIEDDYAAFLCDLYRNPTPGVDYALYTTDRTQAGQEIATSTEVVNGLICNIGDRLGYRAVNGTLCVVVERKKPSIDIFSPIGNAGNIARQLIERNTDPDAPFGIRYTPIVIVDEPAPIAYAANDPLQSIDAQTGLPGSITIPAEGIIDQSNGIVDADPTTTQDLSDSEVQILQDNTNGATIDISLPFAVDTECLEIARNFLALQQELVTTQSMVLGPTSEPKLGQILPDGSIINEINYSYSDSSQYLITITAGPKYLTAGSFQDSQYQLQAEEVTRDATVIQDVGNGAEYVVRVEGNIGERNALSMILDEISVGDKVSVRIFNNPVEHR